MVPRAARRCTVGGRTRVGGSERVGAPPRSDPPSPFLAPAERRSGAASGHEEQSTTTPFRIRIGALAHTLLAQRRGATICAVHDDLRVNVLGSLEVTVGGRVVAIGGELPRRLLARLAVRPGEVVPRDVLIDELWPDTLPRRPADVLRVHLSTLRSRLRAVSATEGDPVARGGGGWALQLPPEAVDHVRFRDLAERARHHAAEGRWAEAYGDGERALELWRGHPFTGLGMGEGLSRAASDLERVHDEVVELWVRSGVELGRAAELLPLLASRVASDPDDEHLARLHALARDSLSVTPRTLPPAPRAQLLGRDDELARLESLVQRHRVVQVLGLGGIGKTSLTLALAHRSDRRVLWLSLTGLRSADLLPVELAHAQGWGAESPPALLVRRVAAELDRCASLVVLDECEHLVDGAADLVEQLVELSPELRVVCTSRRPLPVEGVELVLTPLGAGTPERPGPATRIVADRAGLDPGAPETWTLLEPTVAAAGGVPLALELAGRRLRVEDGPDDAGASRPASDDAVRGSVDAAMALLDPTTAALLRRLAVLPDGVGAELAAELGGRDTPVGLQLDAATRLGLLHARGHAGRRRHRFAEPVRERLRSELDVHHAGSAALDAVARMAAEAMPSWVGAIDHERAAVIDDERANVGALLDEDDELATDGLDRALYCWSRAGRQVETARAVATLLERDERRGSRDPGRRAALLLVQATAAFGFAYKVRHLEQLRAADRLARTSGDADLQLRVSAELVVALGWSGDHAAAQALATEILPLGRELDIWGTCTLGTVDALLWVLEGRADAALAEIERLAGVLDDAGLTQDALGNLVLAASLARIVGRPDQARRLLEAAMDIPLDRFTAYGHGSVACELAQLSMASGEPDTGVRLRHAVEVLEDFGEHRLALLCRRDLGIWLLAPEVVGADPAQVGTDAEQGEQLLRTTLPLLEQVDQRASAVGVAVLAGSGRTGSAERARLRSRALRLANGSGAPLSGWESATVERYVGADLGG